VAGLSNGQIERCLDAGDSWAGSTRGFQRHEVDDQAGGMDVAESERVPAGRRFNDVSKALIEKVSLWSDERWSTPSEVHGESANGRRLVEHMTARSATVVKHIEVAFDRAPSLLEDNGSNPHLIAAGGAVARLFESLDESEIPRLHASASTVSTMSC
jgi:hypothetical protein